jgi:hypothetical protein
MDGSEIEGTPIINEGSLWIGTYLSLILGWIFFQILDLL